MRALNYSGKKAYNFCVEYCNEAHHTKCRYVECRCALNYYNYLEINFEIIIDEFSKFFFDQIKIFDGLSSHDVRPVEAEGPPQLAEQACRWDVQVPLEVIQDHLKIGSGNFQPNR